MKFLFLSCCFKLLSKNFQSDFKNVFLNQSAIRRLSTSPIYFRRKSEFRKTHHTDLSVTDAISLWLPLRVIFAISVSFAAWIVYCWN